MKKILIINANPLAEGLSDSFAKAYEEGARENKAEIQSINLRDLSFDLSLSQGYKGDLHKEPEPDIIRAQEAISWCDHLVIIAPNWWATYPALLKGFIDKAFLPGFAFKYRKDSPLWDKLLKGKSARVIMSMDSPPFYYRFFVHRPAYHSLKKGVLQFCGFSPVRFKAFGSVKGSKPEKISSWVEEVRKMGSKLC